MGKTGFTGGAFDTTIPDDYTYANFEADIKTASPLILAMEVGTEEAQEAAFENKKMVDAFGRLTAYADRNNMLDNAVM